MSGLRSMTASTSESGTFMIRVRYSRVSPCVNPRSSWRPRYGRGCSFEEGHVQPRPQEVLEICQVGGARDGENAFAAFEAGDQVRADGSDEPFVVVVVVHRVITHAGPPLAPPLGAPYARTSLGGIAERTIS